MPGKFTYTIKDIYSDFDIEMPRQADGDVKRVTEYDAVKNSLRNILQTRKGSRRMLPTFGAQLERYLFEPIDEITAREIGNTILQEISSWDSRIEIININVEADYDNSQYNITVTYSIQGTNYRNVDKVIFVLKRT
ncbi:MAG TPA: GPW/gp25 family protein [Bacteroidales bacterium]|nr:GPW/gp25 family protein [Bacteroidales bacterium]